MSSIFMLDTAGDQNLLNEQGSNLLYRSLSGGQERLHLQDSDQDASSSDEDDENAEIELFGVKLNSKDVSKAIGTGRNTKPNQSKVAQELDEVTEKLAKAVENSSKHKAKKRMTKHVVDLDHTEGPDLSMRKENIVKDMQDARRTKNPGLDKEHALPTVGKRKQPILNRIERAKTKGNGWFDLPATEITDEMRNELKIIQMRSVLDPKHFYKKNDLKVLPKYFQIGTVQHSPLDHYREKHTRKSKKSLVDELLADEAFQKFNKRKYNEVIQRTDKYAHRKAMKKMKKLKKHK
ncbi:uncharacterized protein [Drosophila tropicalis]|uniref:uncharacterized protein n=1 Tax=Drosophila tropicalis TaxID=46794 RepID=UPI0035AC0DF2